VSIYCHVVLSRSATAGQLTAVGTALWEWCTGAANGRGIYQYLDNQALADLVAGRLPAADPAARTADRWGVQFGVPDSAFLDRRAALHSLRRALPAAGVDAVRADSTRWSGAAPTLPARPTLERPVGAARRNHWRPAGPRVSILHTPNPAGSP
jgi:hypothetical protein